MPRISEAHRQQMIDRITDATLDCARASGLHDVSMADIIEASGLSAGAIYGYFSGKDELLRAVASRAFEVRLTTLAAAADERPVRPPSEVIGALLHTLVGPRDSGIVVQVWAIASVSNTMGRLGQEAYERVSSALVPYLTAWFADGDGGPRLGATAASRRAAELTPAVAGMLQAWMLRPVVAPGRDADYEASMRAVLDAVAVMT